MASLAKFQTLEEAFLYCRDMDAHLPNDSRPSALRPEFEDIDSHPIEAARALVMVSFAYSRARLFKVR